MNETLLWLIGLTAWITSATLLIHHMLRRDTYTHTTKHQLPETLTHITTTKNHSTITKPGTETINLQARRKTRAGYGGLYWGRKRPTAFFAWTRTPTLPAAIHNMGGMGTRPITSYTINTNHLDPTTPILRRKSDGAIAIIGNYNGPAEITHWDSWNAWRKHHDTI